MAATDRSTHLARLLGPALLAITTTESLNAHIWPTSNAPTVFLNGSMLFVSGLAIIQSHNLWTVRWPVTITLLGWAGLAVGLMRMSYPEYVLERVKGGTARDVRLAAAPVGIIGAFLTVMGYLKSTN